MKNKIFRISFLSLLTIGVISMAGCNTISGAGKDIQSGGHVISNTAQKVQSKI